MFVLFVYLFAILGCVPQLNAARPTLYKPYGDEIESKVSDHEMVATHVQFRGQKLALATYNSWARGSRNGFMNLPGYQLRGTEPDVEGRTDENVRRVIRFVQENPNSIVALQEWSRTDMLKLKEQLPSNYSLKYFIVKGEVFKNIILYNNSKFRKLSSRGNDLNLNRLRWDTSEETGNQLYRYLHVALEDLETNTILDVVNVHLKWRSESESIASFIRNLRDQYDNLVIMGDFNTDMSDAFVPGFVKLVSVDGTQVFSKSGPKTQTNDAILFHIRPNKDED